MLQFSKIFCRYAFLLVFVLQSCGGGNKKDPQDIVLDDVDSFEGFIPEKILLTYNNKNKAVEKWVQNTYGDLKPEDFSNDELIGFLDGILYYHSNEMKNFSFAQFKMYEYLLRSASSELSVYAPQVSQLLQLNCLNKKRARFFCVVKIADFNKKYEKLNKVKKYFHIQQLNFDFYNSKKPPVIREAFQDVLDELKTYFSFPASPYDRLIMLAGFFSGLDPSSYVASHQYLESRTGSGDEDFQGFGFTYGLYGNKLLIRSVFESSGAEEAGLASGDEIIAVNNKNIFDLCANGKKIDLKKCSQLISQLKQKAIFKVSRRGEELVLTLSKKTVVIKNVQFKEYLNAYYLKLKSFTGMSDEGFRDALIQVKDASKPIVIDLRGNSGGDVSAAQNILSLFSKKAKELLLYMSATQYDEETGEFKNYYSNNNVFTKPVQKNYSQHQLIVLIDAESASSSEIIASSLKERNGALIIGERSFGKGVYQSIYDLKKFGFKKLNSGVAMTRGFIFTKNHFSAQNKGVLPHVFLSRYSLEENPETSRMSDYPHALASITGLSPVESTTSPLLKKSTACANRLKASLTQDAPKAYSDIEFFDRDYPLELALQVVQECL